MSMYNMSASVPKTLIRHLVRYAGAKLGGEIAPVVEDILDTPISPELIPSKAGELTQRCLLYTSIRQTLVLPAARFAATARVTL